MGYRALRLMVGGVRCAGRGVDFCTNIINTTSLVGRKHTQVTQVAQRRTFSRWVKEGFLEEVLICAGFLTERERSELGRPWRQSLTKGRRRGLPGDALRGPEWHCVEGRRETMCTHPNSYKFPGSGK